MDVQTAHIKALAAAEQASQELADRYYGGKDGGACGFAWVDISGVRSNSTLGKQLQTVGFRKSYTGTLQLWNRWWYGQSIDAAEEGAQAYARVLREELGLDRVYPGSRLD